MLLSLVDSLRCPAAHAESTLVLSAESWMDSRVWSGELGCPLCHARYPIRNGSVDFAPGVADTNQVPDDAWTSDALRLAAQLGLAEPGGTVLLSGRYAALSPELLGVVDVTCVILDPAGGVAPDAVTFRLADRLPFASGSLRGAAIDAPRNSMEFLTDVVRALRPLGRLVAPSASAVPETLHEIARDEHEYVGEAVSAEPVIALRRAPLR